MYLNKASKTIIKSAEAKLNNIKSFLSRDSLMYAEHEDAQAKKAHCKYLGSELLQDKSLLNVSQVKKRQNATIKQCKPRKQNND